MLENFRTNALNRYAEVSEGEMTTDWRVTLMEKDGQSSKLILIQLSVFLNVNPD